MEEAMIERMFKLARLEFLQHHLDEIWEEEEEEKQEVIHYGY